RPGTMPHAAADAAAAWRAPAVASRRWSRLRLNPFFGQPLRCELLPPGPRRGHRLVDAAGRPPPERAPGPRVLRIDRLDVTGAPRTNPVVQPDAGRPLERTDRLEDRVADAGS